MSIILKINKGTSPHWTLCRSLNSRSLQPTLNWKFWIMCSIAILTKPSTWMEILDKLSIACPFDARVKACCSFDASMSSLGMSVVLKSYHYLCSDQTINAVPSLSPHVVPNSNPGGSSRPSLLVHSLNSVEGTQPFHIWFCVYLPRWK